MDTKRALYKRFLEEYLGPRQPVTDKLIELAMMTPQQKAALIAPFLLKVKAEEQAKHDRVELDVEAMKQKAVENIADINSLISTMLPHA